MNRRSGRVASSLFVALVVGLASVLAWPGDAGGQSSAPVGARLVAQSLLLQPDQAATITLETSGALPADAEIAVVVYNRVTDRAALRDAAGGTIGTAPFRVLVYDVSDVPRDASGRLTVAVPTTSTRSPGGTAIPLRVPGVYPVELLVRANGDELARVVTFLVRLPAEPLVEPLRLALTLWLTGPPAMQPDGSVVIDAGLRARLQTLTSVLAAAPELPLTLVVQPELLDALGRTGVPTDAELQRRLGQLLATRETLPAPYVLMDATAAVQAGLDTELVAQLRRGEDVLAGQLGSATAERATWATDERLDAPAVAFLRDLGFRQLLVPASAVGAENRDAFVTSPGSVPAPGAGRPLTIGVADANLSAAFGPVSEPLRAASMWLAEVALIALTADDPALPRGLVIQPSAWADDPTFLSAVLAGLQANPLVRPVTATSYFAEVSPASSNGELVEAQLTTPEPEDLSAYAARLATTHQALSSYGSMMSTTSAAPAQLEQVLDVSPARDLSPEGRDAYLDAVDVEVDRLRRSVDPVPSRTITLAGRTTELPLTITSRVDEPLQVKVRLLSSKLSFPEGNERLVTLTGGAAQLRVPVEARTSGTFPVTVDILTPVGDAVVAPRSRLTVRSSGLSGLGLALSVGAILVLALWWIRHMLTNHRRRLAMQASLRHPSTSAEP